MTCPLQREQDKGPETAGISPVPPTKAGLRGRAWAGRGVWRRGELKPQSPGLSAAPARRPHLLCWFLASTPALHRHQPRGSPVKLPRGARGASAREAPPGAHGQVPCGLPPRGTRVQDKHLLTEGVALCVSKVERRKDSEITQVGK